MSHIVSLPIWMLLVPSIAYSVAMPVLYWYGYYRGARHGMDRAFDACGQATRQTFGSRSGTH